MIEKRQQAAMDAITKTELAAASGKAVEDGRSQSPNGSVTALNMPPIVTSLKDNGFEKPDTGPVPRFQRWIVAEYVYTVAYTINTRTNIIFRCKVHDHFRCKSRYNCI